MRYRIPFFLALIITIVAAIILRSKVEQGFGKINLKSLEKMDPASCVEPNKKILPITTCLKKFGIKYSLLGDTIEGDFRILFSKPFAESRVEVENWKVVGKGAGLRETWENHECYLHLDTKIPNLTEDSKFLVKKYAQKWFEKNPEASARYIEKVTETDGEVVIHSLPLDNLRNYTEYCEDYFVFHYLDDRPNTDLDETILNKEPLK